MSESTSVLPKPKKSVALSGTAAGNTALCTVGRSGNDLHYRGYDILDFADDGRVRGDRAPAGARQAADARRTRRLQGQAEVAARRAGGGQGRAGAAAAVGASDGRDAHRRVGAGLRVAREGRPQPSGRARHRRQADGIARLDAAVLVPLQPQRQAHRRRNRRRFDRRPFPAPAARREAARVLGARDAHLADPLRRTRVQRIDLRRARDRRHRQRHVFLHRRRDRRAARPEARRRQRSRVRHAEALRHARTRPRPTSARASSARKS